MANDPISGANPPAGAIADASAKVSATAKSDKTQKTSKVAGARPKAPVPTGVAKAATTDGAIDETQGPSLLFSQVFGDVDQSAFDSNAIMELIDSLRSKVKGEQIELARAQISQHRKLMESKHNKTISDLKESQKKQEESKTANVVTEALTWIAFALAMILAVVTAIVSFGAGSAAVGAVALIGAAIAVTVTILNETGAMDKISDALGKCFEDVLVACGVPKEDAKKAGKLIAQIVIAVLIIAIEIALAVFSGGASMEEAAEEITSVVAQRATKVALKAIQIGHATAAAVDIGAASSGMASGIMLGQSELLTADAMKEKGIIKKLEAALERDKSFIRQLVQLLEMMHESTIDALETGHRTREKISTGQTSLA